MAEGTGYGLGDQVVADDGQQLVFLVEVIGEVSVDIEKIEQHHPDGQAVEGAHLGEVDGHGGLLQPEPGQLRVAGENLDVSHDHEQGRLEIEQTLPPGQGQSQVGVPGGCVGVGQKDAPAHGQAAGDEDRGGGVQGLRDAGEEPFGPGQEFLALPGSGLWW